ncbi:TlpA family protein disulfide reductase [Sphingobacterium sp. SGG-5]|uniref:TlpA family protein disulfide reductase n=1 Tax=Sphingobacterium sp. SGG-5 TaxID=2710881 RepID=UPI0013EC2299|nr:TlpA disulfide reductase family protein [Sphingobacterium sp. SGG-5]NGM62817.1 TlpA family protein disulfide reductase [Sphingobacterium sp. SGG-5]
MNNNKENSKGKIATVRQYLRKNGTSILIGLALIVILVSPDAKSWALRQLMNTGFFNAKIETNNLKTDRLSTVAFDFVDSEGNIRNTVSLRGKVVFINFWASWCPPCRAEFPSIEKLYGKFKDHPDIFFLMINEDNDMAIAHRYLQKEKYTVPLYQTKGKVPSEIYTGVLPTTVVLDKGGTVRYHHTGFANYGSEKFMKQINELIME